MAAGREEGEVELYGALEFSTTATEQRPVAAIEPELLAMGADEVEHRAVALVGGLAQSSTELLEEQRRTLGRTEHQDGVEDGNVDALIEQVDREHDLNPAGGEVLERTLAFGPRAVTPDGHGADAVAVEVLGHELGVLDAHAEPETPHRGWIPVLGDLVHDEPRPRVRARVHVGERGGVVATTSAPRDLRQIKTIVDPVVEKRGQVLLVDRIPQAEFCRDAVVEPVEDRQPVAAFRGRRQSEQFDRIKMVEHSLVRGGRCVMKLVNDDDVEVIGSEILETAGVQALDRPEDVIELRRPGTAHPLLAERWIAQRVPERRHARIEDLLSVRDEQQARAVEPGPEGGVVERGHHGLAGAGR